MKEQTYTLSINYADGPYKIQVAIIRNLTLEEARQRRSLRENGSSRILSSCIEPEAEDI